MNNQIDVPETRRIVLSVNDQVRMERGIWDWLFGRGVALLRASSTTRALELLEKTRVDIIISDLARQEGSLMNPKAGMQLAMAVRKLGSPVPIVIYTNNKAPEVHKLALDAGANFVTESPTGLTKWLEQLGL